MKRIAIVIPTYNHVKQVVDTAKEALKLNLPVIIVDDGSTDGTFDELKKISGIILLRHNTNKGKGAAIISGFKEAVKIADWAVTFDSDGQHFPEDSIKLIDYIPKDKKIIIIGRRTGMKGIFVPWTSRFGRQFSNFWVCISGGPHVSDSQSGFRIYPIPEAMNLDVKSMRYQFEVEILVNANQKNIPVIEVPVRVKYQPKNERISHFHPLIDFLRNTAAFKRLIIQRLFKR